MASDYAMSQPAFAPERHEIWYTDGATGFYVVHVADSVWPKDAAPASTGTGGPKACKSRRSSTVTVRVPRRARVRSVRATLAGKRVKTTRKGRRVRVRVSLKGLPSRGAKLVVRIRLRGGRTITRKKTYYPCGAKASTSPPT